MLRRCGLCRRRRGRRAPDQGATIIDRVEIAGDDLTQDMREAAFVAYDAAGSEIGRIPLFPHLQR